MVSIICSYTSVVRIHARMKQDCMNGSHFIALRCSLVLKTLSLRDQVLDTASAGSPLRYLICSGCQNDFILHMFISSSVPVSYAQVSSDTTKYIRD